MLECVGLLHVCFCHEWFRTLEYLCGRLPAMFQTTDLICRTATGKTNRLRLRLLWGSEGSEISSIQNSSMSLCSQLGSIEDLSSLTAYFFDKILPTTSDNWNESSWEWPGEEESTKAEYLSLHEVLVAISPTAEIIALAKNEKICVYSKKLFVKDDEVQYQPSFKGVVSNPDANISVEITAIACVPVASSQKSGFGMTDWTCIIVGTASGHIYFYTETGKILFCQQFHDNTVQNIKCRTVEKTRRIRSLEPASDEVIILYDKQVVCLDVFGLFQTLKACRNQLAGANSSSVYELFQPPPLSFKKWGLASQESINDAAFVGMTVTNSFDHLVTASVQGGFSAGVYGSPPLFFLYAACGTDPFLAFHYGQEGASNFVLSQVAMDIAGKVTSAFFSAASSWFGGSNRVEQKPKLPKIEMPTPAVCRFGLEDNKRMGLSLALSPDSSLVAVTDSLARVLLVDAAKGTVVRIWKGYRNAECGWIEACNGSKSVLFLVIHVPRRGLLEVWLGPNGQRIAAINVPYMGRLFCPGRSIVGNPFSTPLHQVMYMSPGGCLSSINVSYEQAIVCMSNAKTRDAQLLDTILKTLNDEPIKIDELVETIKNLKSAEMLSKALVSVLSARAISCESLSDIAEVISERADGEVSSAQGRLLLQEVSRLKSLLMLYQHLSENHCLSDNQPVEDIDCRKTASTEQERMALDEILYNFSQSLKDSRQPQRITITEFLACFEQCHGAEYRRSSSIKSNLSEDHRNALAQNLLQKVIERKVECERWIEILRDGGLVDVDVFQLALHYWLQLQTFKPVQVIESIGKLLKLFLSIDAKREAYLMIVEAKLKATTNIPVALILALSVRYTIKDLQLAVTGEEDAEMDQTTEEMNKSEEWEGASVSFVEWDMLVENLLHIFYLHRLIRDKPDLAVSFDMLKDKGRGSVTEVVAQYIVGTDCDVVGLLRPAVGGENHFDNQLGPLQLNLNNLKEVLPFSMEVERLLCICSIEFMSAWAKDKDQITKLARAIGCANALENAYLRHGTTKLLWSTFVCSHFSLIASLTEESGRIPSDSKYTRLLGASERHIPKFLRFCDEILNVCIDAGSHLSTEMLPFFKHDSVFKNGRTPTFETAVQQRTINIDLALMHQQLCSVLLSMSRFDIRNVKIYSLFDQETKAAFFKDLGSYPILPGGEPTYAITSRRVQYLKRVVSALTKELVDKRKREKWLRKVLGLAKVWRCCDGDFKISVVEILFSQFADDEGMDLSSTVNDLPMLGKVYLRIAAERLKLHLLKSEMTAYFLSTLSPRVSSWLQRQAEATESSPLKNICALLTKASSWLPGESFEYEACVSLHATIVELFE